MQGHSRWQRASLAGHLIQRVGENVITQIEFNFAVTAAVAWVNDVKMERK